MSFIKEVLVNAISNLNDFDTIRLIAQDYFTVSLLIIFFIPLIVFIIGAVSFAKDNLYIAVIIAFMIQLFLIILTILGFLPYLFPIV